MNVTHVLRCARLAARLARAAADSLEATPGAALPPIPAAAPLPALLAALIAAPVDAVVDDDALEPLIAGIGQAQRRLRRGGARRRRRCAVVAPSSPTPPPLRWRRRRGWATR